jgi:hypothetical protein
MSIDLIQVWFKAIPFYGWPVVTGYTRAVIRTTRRHVTTLATDSLYSHGRRTVEGELSVASFLDNFFKGTAE